MTSIYSYRYREYTCRTAIHNIHSLFSRKKTRKASPCGFLDGHKKQPRRLVGAVSFSHSENLLSALLALRSLFLSRLLCLSFFCHTIIYIYIADSSSTRTQIFLRYAYSKYRIEVYGLILFFIFLWITWCLSLCNIIALRVLRISIDVMLCGYTHRKLRPLPGGRR